MENTKKCSCRYSRLDGQCNNILKPLWGARTTPFTRLLPAAYDDGIHIICLIFFLIPFILFFATGIHVIRKSVTGKQLPSVRHISNRVLQRSAYVSLPKDMANYFSFIYGQFIAHDCGLFVFYQQSKYIIHFF